MKQTVTLTVGLLIESWRHHHNLSVTDMARQVKVARQTIIRIEAEVSRPRRATLQKLALVLNCDLDDLESLKDQVEAKERRHRGGKQSRRDREFPEFQNPEFRKWWHRKGKAMNGGRDIETRGEAKERYKDWENEGRPRVKLLTLQELSEVLREISLATDS